VFDLANIYGDRYEMLQLNNPKKGTLLGSIAAFFADADQDDISVLYLLSHGTIVNGQYRWLVAGSKEYITEADLTSVLEDINGKVVLMLVSCRAGQYLEEYTTSEAAASLKGVISSVNGSRPGNAHINIIAANTYELRGAYTDAVKEQAFDFFSRVFNEALGWDQLNGASLDHLPADANGDGVVSMQELAEYLAQNLPLVLQQHLGQYGSQSVLNTPQQNVNYYLTTPNQTFYARAKARLMAKLGRDGQ
jgi:hypothetical protein